MDYFDNPAGRLYAVLSRYNAQPPGNVRIECWAAALDVPAEDVPIKIATVHELFRQTREAADAAPRAFDPIPAHLREIHQSVFGMGIGWQHTLNDAPVPTVAFQALDMFSVYLHTHAPQGEVPDDEKRDSLRTMVTDLIDAVAEDDLPTDVRRGFLNRLADMLDALDHMETKGPEAVRRAAEVLAVGGFEKQASVSLRTRVLAVAGAISIAFTAVQGAASTVNELAAAAETIGLIESGDEQKQIGPGPQPEAGEERPTPDSGDGASDPPLSAPEI